MVKFHKRGMKFNLYVENEKMLAHGDDNTKCSSLARLYWLGKIFIDIAWV